MAEANRQLQIDRSQAPSFAVLLGASVGIFLYANFPMLLTEAAAQSNLVAEYHHSFKGNAGKREGFEFFGANAKHYVRFDPDGLRLTLPIGVEEKRPTAGVATDIGVTGDFEITVSFEVLDEPAPEGGPDKQTRFTVDIVLDKVGLNAASLSRTVYGKGVEYVTWSGLQAEASAKPQVKMHYLPAKGKSGSLRLVRTRSALAYYASPEAGDNFTLLQQHPFGTEDLKTVRLVGTTGAANASLDVRVTDLRIRAEALSNLPPAPEVQTPQQSGRSFLWLLAAMLVLLIVTIGGLMFWFLVKRHKVRQPSQSIIPGQNAGPTSSPPAGIGQVGDQDASVLIQCPSCRKRMKVLAHLPGRKLKCPDCAATFVA